MITTIHEGQGNGREVRIDLNTLIGLCQYQHTLKEVAGIFHCSEDTIQRLIRRQYDQTWTEFFDEHSAAGKSSLRRALWKKGVDQLDPKILVHLAAHYLGQTPKVQQDVTVKRDLSDLSDDELLRIISAGKQ
jgi:hypothetical protein